MHIKNRYHCTLCMYISIYIYIYILNNPRFWSHQVYVYYKYYTAPKPSHLFRSLHKLPCDSKARRVLRKIVRRFIILWYATFCVIDYEKQNKTKKRSKRNVVRVLKKRWRKNKKKERVSAVDSINGIDRPIDRPVPTFSLVKVHDTFLSDSLFFGHADHFSIQHKSDTKRTRARSRQHAAVPVPEMRDYFVDAITYREYVK